ncbi:MAG: CHAT domain-containing protein [Pseudomarimonas sp.]
MRWFWMCLLLGGALHARPMPMDSLPITTAVDGCADTALPVASFANPALRITGLDSDRQYLIELHEHGIDVRIAAGAGKARWINSEPWGYATEPVSVHSNAQGEVRLNLRVANHFAWARLQVVVNCFEGNEGQRWQSLSRRSRIAEQIAAVNSEGDEVAALAALIEAWGALWNADASGESRARLWTLIQLSHLASWGGLAAERIAWSRLVIQEATAMGDSIPASFALVEIAGALLLQGAPGADEAFAQVITQAERLQLADLSARAANGRCILLRTGGDAAAAARCYQTTIKRFAAIGDLSAEAGARNSRATALLFDGRYAQAREELELAAAVAKRSENDLLMARVWLVQAQLARWDGNFERSLMLLDDALTLHRRLGRVVDVARVERQIAQTYELAQEPLRAEHFFRSSLLSAQQRNEETVVADIQVSLAKLAATRADFVGSLELLDLATTRLSRDPSNSLYTTAMLQRANIELAAGRPQAARTTLELLSESARSLQWRNQMRLHALRLRLGTSTPQFDAESTLSPAADQALAKGDLTLFLELAEALQMARETRGDAGGALAIAATAIERGVAVAAGVRSPALRNGLLSKLKIFAAAPLWQLANGPLDGSAARLALSSLELLRAIEQQPFATHVDADTLIEIERALADADASQSSNSPERERLLLRLTATEAKLPKATAATRPLHTDDIVQRAQAIGQRGSLLYVIVAGDRAGAMTFDRGAWKWRDDLDAAGIRQATRALQLLLANAHGSRDAIDGQVMALSTALRWPALFERAPERLQLLIDGSLSALPWALLPAPGDPTKRLVETSELTVLQSLRSERLADFSRLHLGAAASAVSDTLPVLAAASRELAEVSGQWPALPQRRLPAMTRNELADALADPDALVHLAAHGSGETGRVEDAGLWLVNKNGEPDFVSALRLRRMPVAAALVVLGACDTATSSSGRSLGVGGVAGSLIDAGAGAVLATRWPVSDRVAQAFAREFHQRLAQVPESPAEALKGAVLALRQAPFSRHPTHWAGWFLLRNGPSLDP